MKARIILDKDKEIQVSCDTCKGTDFYDGLVNEEEVKVCHAWSGDYRDGLEKNEVIKLVCKTCGRVYYFQNDYNIDAGCYRFKLED